MSLAKEISDKKVNFEFNKEFINVFSKKIKENDTSFLNRTLTELHPADSADLIENLVPENRLKLIELEGFSLDPEIFIELNESIQSDIFIILSIESIVNILKRLESDNALKILENLDEKKKNIVFAVIDLISNYLTGDINITSPTGLKNFKDLTGMDLAVDFWNFLEKNKI